MTSVANRLEYSHMDSIREVKESLEKANHRVDNLEQRFDQSPSDTPSSLHSLSLHFANVVVEVLKLLMFLSSVACDFLKPITGTRSRAAIVIIVVLVAFLFSSLLPTDWTLSNALSKLRRK